MEGPAGSWSRSRSLSLQIVELSDLARLLDTSHLINWNQLAEGLSIRFSGMSQTGLDGAAAPDCLRHGATLSKAYLNIALLPSKCNPNPHFYPWKLWGGGVVEREAGVQRGFCIAPTPNSGNPVNK